MTFEVWIEHVDQLGIKERIFDAPDVQFLCPASRARRPYRGTEGFFFEAFVSGMSPRQALGECLVEQECE
jgi:hypothetical protein